MASQMSLQAKKREKERWRETSRERERAMVGGLISAMNEKRQNNGLVFSVLRPDAFHHKQLGMGGSG